eukprot:scaffold9834_cov105-Isochrysis_galbana.AAC.4
MGLGRWARRLLSLRARLLRGNRVGALGKVAGRAVLVVRARRSRNGGKESNAAGILRKGWRTAGCLVAEGVRERHLLPVRQSAAGAHVALARPGFVIAVPLPCCMAARVPSPPLATATGGNTAERGSHSVFTEGRLKEKLLQQLILPLRALELPFLQRGIQTPFGHQRPPTPRSEATVCRATRSTRPAANAGLLSRPTSANRRREMRSRPRCQRQAMPNRASPRPKRRPVRADCTARQLTEGMGCRRTCRLRNLSAEPHRTIQHGAGARGQAAAARGGGGRGRRPPARLARWRIGPRRGACRARRRRQHRWYERRVDWAAPAATGPAPRGGHPIRPIASPGAPSGAPSQVGKETQSASAESEATPCDGWSRGWLCGCSCGAASWGWPGRWPPVTPRYRGRRRSIEERPWPRLDGGSTSSKGGTTALPAKFPSTRLETPISSHAPPPATSTEPPPPSHPDSHAALCGAPRASGREPLPPPGSNGRVASKSALFSLRAKEDETEPRPPSVCRRAKEPHATSEYRRLAAAWGRESKAGGSSLTASAPPWPHGSAPSQLSHVPPQCSQEEPSPAWAPDAPHTPTPAAPSLLHPALLSSAPHPLAPAVATGARVSTGCVKAVARQTVRRASSSS